MKKMMILLASLAVCFGCQKSDDVQPINESEMTRAGEAIITARSICSLSGTVTGGGIYSPGDTCTVVAMSNNGRGFAGWYDESGVRKSNKSNYTFVVSGKANLEARFNTATGSWSLETSVSKSPTDDTGMPIADGYPDGKVLNGNTYLTFPRLHTGRDGTSVAIVASPRSAFGNKIVFSHWEDVDSGAILSRSQTYVVSMTRDHRVKAVFKRG